MKVTAIHDEWRNLWKYSASCSRRRSNRWIVWQISWKLPNVIKYMAVWIAMLPKTKLKESTKSLIVDSVKFASLERISRRCSYSNRCWVTGKQQRRNEGNNSFYHHLATGNPNRKIVEISRSVEWLLRTKTFLLLQLQSEKLEKQLLVHYNVLLSFRLSPTVFYNLQ